MRIGWIKCKCVVVRIIWDTNDEWWAQIAQIVNSLGFHPYHVTDIDTGHSFTTFSKVEELKRCEEIAVEILPEDFITNVNEDDKTAFPEDIVGKWDPPVQPTKTQWTVLNEGEVDHFTESRHDLTSSTQPHRPDGQHICSEVRCAIAKHGTRGDGKFSCRVNSTWFAFNFENKMR